MLMCAIDKILSTPKGNVLLAGRSGTGRRSALMLMASMHEIKVLTPKVGVGYTVKTLQNELKQVSQDTSRIKNVC